MADKLLRERGAKPVGKNWVNNLVKRSPELQKRWTRLYDRQRAACEDPAVIQQWFDLIKATKEEWGVVDDDVYNFNKTSFIIGKILSQIVITALEGYSKKKQV